VDYVAVGLSDLGKPKGYLERQVRGWTERYYGSKTNDYPEVEKISAWMQEHMPSTRSVSLIHNDYKYDNVVLDSSDITTIVGVLDWEMCTIGDPLTDLGTTLAYWIDAEDPEELQRNRWGPTNVPGSLTRAEIVHDYARKTGDRFFTDRILSCVRTLQTRRDRSANLLPLPSGPNQGRTLCLHARNHSDAPARFLAHRADRTDLATRTGFFIFAVPQNRMLSQRDHK